MRGERRAWRRGIRKLSRSVGRARPIWEILVGWGLALDWAVWGEAWAGTMAEELAEVSLN